MSTLRYLAYGSNLHPFRLQQRIASARLVGTVKLPGWRLSFDKLSIDGSGKATLHPAPGAMAYGAVYDIASADKHLLDQFEGCGAGYLDRSIELALDGQKQPALVYMAQDGYTREGLCPYDWYLALVVAGARYHRFPGDYVHALETVRAIEDRNEPRALEHQRLLEAFAPGGHG